MKQRALNKMLTPPGQWRARCPHCGFWLKHYEWQAFERMVLTHNKSNEHPEWDYETAACDQLPPGSCLYANGEHPEPFDGDMDVESLRGTALALAELTRQYFFGSPLVDQSEAERRAAICSRCPMNLPVRACVTCRGMESIRTAIHAVVGQNSTSVDKELQGCRICKCHTRTIAWIKPDILEKGFTDKQRTKTTKIAPHCWKLAIDRNGPTIAAHAE